MATTRGSFAQLLAPGLQEVMFERLKEHPEEYSQFLSVETSDGAFDEDQVLAGLGLATRKPESEPITYDDPIQGGTKRYIHDTYALGWQVTMEMKDDDRYNIIRQIPGELMKSCRQSWESVGANVINLGDSTVTTADGVSLFNSAHPLLGGGTLSNILNPAVDISVTAIQDLLILAENMTNDRGLKVRITPKYLWIPPDLQFIAKKVLKSELEPATGNNDVNPVQGVLTPRILHFLTSSTHWYVSADKSDCRLKMKWRKKPVTDATDDFETKGSKHSIVFRLSAGATDWRGWWASLA